MLTWFIAAPAAGAGTVQTDPDQTHLTFTAGAGETNDLYIFQVPDGYRVLDLGAAVTPAAGCTAVTANQAFCALPVTFVEPGQIDVSAGDLDDFVSISGTEAFVTVTGDDGDDVLEVNVDCVQTCFDVNALNSLAGGTGDDTLSAGTGDNLFDGGPGADAMSGASHAFVTIDYSTRTNAVTVDPNGVADDGEAGEGDNVGAEPGLRIVGGSGDDQLTAGARTRVLIGGEGNDTLSAVETGDFDLVLGGPGNDVLLGGPDADSLHGGDGDDTISGGAGFLDEIFGGSGNDTLRGGAGPDEISGAAGNDLLIGGLGRDRLFGGRDDDTLRARDGRRDRVGGGPGSDRARIDRGLDVVSNIEGFF